MDVLLRANRAAEAAKAYNSFITRLPKTRTPSDRATFLAVRSLLAAKDQPAAAELAEKVAKRTLRPHWRHLAILLALDSPARSAMAMLPRAAEADLRGCALGLIASVQAKDAASTQKWADRIGHLGRASARVSGAQGGLADYRLLSIIASERHLELAGEAAALTQTAGVGRAAAAELVSYASESKLAAVEASELLKATLASHLGRHLAGF